MCRRCSWAAARWTAASGPPPRESNCVVVHRGDDRFDRISRDRFIPALAAREHGRRFSHIDPLVLVDGAPSATKSLLDQNSKTLTHATCAATGTSIAKMYGGPMGYGRLARARTVAQMSQCLRSLVLNTPGMPVLKYWKLDSAGTKVLEPYRSPLKQATSKL